MTHKKDKDAATHDVHIQVMCTHMSKRTYTRVNMRANCQLNHPHLTVPSNQAFLYGRKTLELDGVDPTEIEITLDDQHPEVIFAKGIKLMFLRSF